MDKATRYTKAFAALVAAIATSLLTVLTDGDAAKVLTIVVAVAGVIAVYQFPNDDTPHDAGL